MELKQIKIKSIRKLSVQHHVYDLSVQGNHNFFIGNSKVLTHNCDYLSRDAQPALRNLMEEYSSNTRFILTANYIERIIEPLISRTQEYKLLPPTKKEVAKRMVEILKLENVAFDIPTVAQIVNVYYPDIRKIINTMNLQTQDGKLTVSVEQLIAQDVKLTIIDVLTGNLPLKDKISETRKIVSEHQIQDYTDIYKLLFEHVDTYAGNKVPQTVIALAEGQFRDGQVPDKELNFVATLYTILTN